MKGMRLPALAVIGTLFVIAAPIERAQAVSLINPGAAATVQQDARKQTTTEVRWHGHHHHWGRWHHHHHHWDRWHHRHRWGRWHHHHRWHGGHWHRHHHRHWW